MPRNDWRLLIFEGLRHSFLALLASWDKKFDPISSRRKETVALHRASGRWPAQRGHLLPDHQLPPSRHQSSGLPNRCSGSPAFDEHYSDRGSAPFPLGTSATDRRLNATLTVASVQASSRRPGFNTAGGRGPPCRRTPAPPVSWKPLTIDQHGADLLFQVISRRYERGSIVLTTNKPFKQRASIFNNDSTIASAVLDRLLHHAETVVIEGASYRMKDQIEP